MPRPSYVDGGVLAADAGDDPLGDDGGLALGEHAGLGRARRW